MNFMQFFSVWHRITQDKSRMNVAVTYFTLMDSSGKGFLDEGEFVAGWTDLTKRGNGPTILRICTSICARKKRNSIPLQRSSSNTDELPPISGRISSNGDIPVASESEWSVPAKDIEVAEDYFPRYEPEILPDVNLADSVELSPHAQFIPEVESVYGHEETMADTVNTSESDLLTQVTPSSDYDDQVQL